MDKQIVIHPYNGILFINKGDWDIKVQAEMGHLFSCRSTCKFNYWNKRGIVYS